MTNGSDLFPGFDRFLQDNPAWLDEAVPTEEANQIAAGQRLQLWHFLLVSLMAEMPPKAGTPSEIQPLRPLIGALPALRGRAFVHTFDPKAPLEHYPIIHGHILQRQSSFRILSA